MLSLRPVTSELTPELQELRSILLRHHLASDSASSFSNYFSEKTTLFSAFLAWLYDASEEEVEVLLEREFDRSGSGVIYQNPYRLDHIIFQCSKQQAARVKMKYPLVDIDLRPIIFDQVSPASLPAQNLALFLPDFSEFLSRNPQFMQDKVHYLYHQGYPQKKIDEICHKAFLSDDEEDEEIKIEPKEKVVQSKLPHNKVQLPKHSPMEEDKALGDDYYFLLTLCFVAEENIHKRLALSRIVNPILSNDNVLPLPSVLTNLVADYLNGDVDLVFPKVKSSRYYLSYRKTLVVVLDTTLMRAQVFMDYFNSIQPDSVGYLGAHRLNMHSIEFQYRMFFEPAFLRSLEEAYEDISEQFSEEINANEDISQKIVAYQSSAARIANKLGFGSPMSSLTTEQESKSLVSNLHRARRRSLDFDARSSHHSSSATHSNRNDEMERVHSKSL